MMVVVEEVRLDRHGVREIERADAEDAVERDFRVARPDDLRGRVQPAHPRLDRRGLRLVHEIDLVDDDAVGGDDLVDRLVVVPVQARVVEVLPDVLRVHQRDDPVERDLSRHLVVDEEGRRDRLRIGEPARLDQDVVEFLAPTHEILEDLDEIGAHAADAADAAVRELVDLLLGGEHQPGVDVHFAELVLDDRDAVAVALGENVVEQRRLPRSEEAGEDGDGNRRRGPGVRHFHRACPAAPRAPAPA